MPEWLGGAGKASALRAPGQRGSGLGRGTRDPGLAQRMSEPKELPAAAELCVVLCDLHALDGLLHEHDLGDQLGRDFGALEV